MSASGERREDVDGAVFLDRIGQVETVGDQVAVDPSLPCGDCHYCRRGRFTFCERWNAVGVSVAGAAAEYVAVPAANCVRLPEGIRTADAALVEPLSCAVRGYDVLRSSLAEHYLVYGAGTMGLIMTALAMRAGAVSVDVVDVNPARLEAARVLGCTGAVTDAAQLDRPRGWDAVIDCTGVVEAIEDGITRVGKGGTFLQFGVAGEGATARFSPHRVYSHEITIVGSLAVLHSFDRAAELFVAGVVDPDLLISDRLPLAEYPAAVQRVRAGVGRKVQVIP